jgi:hypothetical protein
MHVSTFSTNFYKTSLILRRIQHDAIVNVHQCSRKYPLFLSDSNKPWNVAKDFQNILKYQISWQSVQWEPSRSKRTNGRSNVELQVSFHNALDATFCPQTSFMCLLTFLRTKTVIISVYGIDTGLQTSIVSEVFPSIFFLFTVNGLWADNSNQHQREECMDSHLQSHIFLPHLNTSKIQLRGPAPLAAVHLQLIRN